MKTFWQHENSMVYVVESDTFGQVTGAAGPIDPSEVRPLSEYTCGPGILTWVKRAMAQRTLRRVNITPVQGGVGSPPSEATVPPKPTAACRPRPDAVPIASAAPAASELDGDNEVAARRRFGWSTAYHL